MKPGDTHRAKVGALEFMVIILDAEFTDDSHSRYGMDAVKVKVELQLAQGQQRCRKPITRLKLTHLPCDFAF